MEVTATTATPNLTYSFFTSTTIHYQSNLFTSTPPIVITPNEVQQELISPPIWLTFLIISISVPMIFLMLVGNLLILLIYFLHRPIRTLPSNLYLVSLAFADFLTGLVVIPAVDSTIHSKWLYGLPSCKVWLTLTLMTNVVTAFHLVAIAVDRYRTVTEGIPYVQRRTHKSVSEKLVVIWILSLWVMSPLIFDWEHLSMDPSAAHTCVSNKTPHWVVHFSCASFWLPASFLIITYHKVYQEIKRRLSLVSHRGRTFLIEPTSSEIRNEKLSSDWLPEISAPPSSSATHPPACLSAISEDQILKNDSKNPHPKQKFFSLKPRERRSIITMTIISGGFILCWLPWNCVSFYDAFVNDNTSSSAPSSSKLSGNVYTATVILGQVNSFINPLIYTSRLPEFRTGLNVLLHKLHFKK